MKTIIYMLLFAMLAPLWLSNCKDKPNNPEPQPRGNYWSKMTCKVDGKDWGDCKPTGVSGNTSYTSAVWALSIEGQPLSLEFINSCDSLNSMQAIQSIYIKINAFKGVGTYALSNTNYGICANLRSAYLMRTNARDTGILIINQFDTNSNRITGSFSFTAYNSDSERVVKVADATFTQLLFSRN